MSKIAMVTGAADGIGKGICIELAKAGYDIMVHSGTSEQKALLLCEELISKYKVDAQYVVADLLDPGSYAKIFDAFDSHFDHLDLFVNNAGITEGKPFLEMTQEIFDRVTDIDFKGAYFCTQAAAQRMVEKGIHGNIILLSSNLRERIQQDMSVYGPVKYAISRLAQHEAMELAQFGIRVNAIAPGWVDSTARLDPYRGSSLRHIPLKKWATVEQIGQMILYIVSPAGDFFTGSVLTFDGGASNQRDPDYTFDQGEWSKKYNHERSVLDYENSKY